MSLPPPTPPYGTTGDAAATLAVRVAVIEAHLNGNVVSADIANGTIIGDYQGAGTGDISPTSISASNMRGDTTLHKALYSTNGVNVSWEHVPPVGVVVDFAGSSAPSGWLLCFGQSLLRSDYADLFTAIGTTYGAADGTHFSLPDLRGRVAAGVDNMGGSTASRITNAGAGIVGTTLGAAGGTQTHTMSTAEMPAHAHTIDVYTGPGSAAPGPGAGTTLGGTWPSGSQGGGGAHQNTQPTMMLNKIIFTGV